MSTYVCEPLNEELSTYSKHVVKLSYNFSNLKSKAIQNLNPGRQKENLLTKCQKIIISKEEKKYNYKVNKYFKEDFNLRNKTDTLFLAREISEGTEILSK